MDQPEAYACLQSFVLQFLNSLTYHTNEGDIILWASKIRTTLEQSNYPVYKGTVTWRFDPRKPNYLFQPVTWSDRMTGGTRKLAYPAKPQRYYTRPGVAPIPSTGVNWKGDGYGGGYFEGVDCYSPEGRIVAKQQLLASLVTSEYLLFLKKMSKTVNNAPFRGLPPGTVLYLGADIEEGMNNENRVADLTHQFVVEPNMENFTFDGIQVDRKGGHEYLWATSFVGEGLCPVTDQVFVAPMYNESDLNLLGLT
jgi:hypothetical protein